MKTLKPLIIGLLLSLISCNTTEKLYESKNYDQVIDKLVPKAKNNNITEQQVDLLAKSYHQANEDDHERIIELKKSGQPDIWIEIYYKLCSIDMRQNKINTLPEDIRTAINYKKLSLKDEIKNSKEKSELYLYAKANMLLKNPTPENLKEASFLVNRLQKINPNNQNIDNLIFKLVILSSKHILFRVATPTDLNLPEDFAALTLNFTDNQIYNIPFDIVPNENIKYDLMIRIMIESKEISPERTDAVAFEEKKDGLVAKVTDKTMSKSATIKGQIEYVDIDDEKILISIPFDVTSTFSYNYAAVRGDQNACSEQTLALTQKEAIDFPSNEALLKDTARKLNAILKTTILNE